jgi:hypothetical protein
MPQDREESVARPREAVDHAKSGARWRCRCDARDIRPNEFAERIADRFERRAREDADPLSVPLGRPHAIERDRVWVAEAVAAEFLDLPKLDDFVSLRGAQ